MYKETDLNTRHTGEQNASLSADRDMSESSGVPSRDASTKPSTSANGTALLTGDKNKDAETILSVTSMSNELLSRVKGADWPDTVPAVWDMFISSVAQHRDALAIASVHQKDEFYGMKNLPLDHEKYWAQPYIRWTCGEVIKAITLLVEALQRHIEGPGSPIFTFVDNCAEFPIIFWAAATLGCTIVPIHPRNLLNKEEIAHILTTALSTASANQPVLFVQNDDIAMQVLKLNVLQNPLVITIEPGHPKIVHYSFGDLVDVDESEEMSSLAANHESATQWKLIMFTSGTTALPKGVVLNASLWDRWILKRRLISPLVPGDSILSIFPNNHIFYYVNLLTFPCVGGAMVFPGATFSPQAVPEIMEMEHCTHLPMPPTMIHALCQVALAKSVKFSTLKNITIGGSKLSVELLRDCFDILGSQGIELAYGLTEIGSAISTGIIRHADEIVRDEDAAVGWVDLGGEIKICAPGESTPLPRNMEGEVHYSSISAVDSYVGEESPDSFYTDDNGRKWFTTGDAAVMDNEGLIFIIGRIKDMIIRGAENISPSAMEQVLAQDSRTKIFDLQVVGKLDPIAGEIPVAISRKDVTDDDIQQIQDTVLKKMGPAFILDEVISLSQLGLEDFPKTTLGKVQKAKLSRIVREHVAQQESLPRSNYIGADELISKVQRIWKRTIGHNVDLNANTSDFADSITIMRIRDRYDRDLGIKITLEEILATNNIKEQVELLRKASRRSNPRQPIEPQPNVLTEKDLIHLADKPGWFLGTKAYITEQISKSGLSWEDIAAIVPASDFTHTFTQADILNTSWSWKFALASKAGIDKQRLRKSVEVVLTHNPILPSFLFHENAAFGSDISLHVIPKSGAKLFNAVFRDYGSVPTKKDFAKLVEEPYEYRMTELPGILVQFLLFDIVETGQSGTIVVAHHAVTDASYLQLVFEDLDKALGGATVLDQHISYKVWAESYYALRTSHAAQVAANWHINRLQNLSSYRDSVFPALPRSQSRHTQAVDDNGHHTNFSAKGITNLRQKHPALSAPIIIKTAWSLLNVARNQTNAAVFSNLQADRRRFPFVPKALESLSPAHTFEASNVAGQILQDVINIIPLYPEESVLKLLYRVAADQEELNTYAAAPLQTILQAVGPINSEIMLDIFRSQIFNWTPGLGAMQTHNPNENYEPLSSFIRPSLRLVINVDVGGHDNETVFTQIKSPLYDMNGLQSLARDFEDLVLWVCDELNWNTRSGDYKNALRAASEANLKVKEAQG